MSSRHQKEKRLRPRSNPYKRDRFDQTRYVRVTVEEQQEPPVIAAAVLPPADPFLNNKNEDAPVSKE